MSFELDEFENNLVLNHEFILLANPVIKQVKRLNRNFFFESRNQDI